MEMRISDMGHHKYKEIVENTEKIVMYRLCEIHEDINEDMNIEEHTDEIYKLVKTMLMLQDIKTEAKQ